MLNQRDLNSGLNELELISLSCKCLHKQLNSHQGLLVLLSYCSTTFNIWLPSHGPRWLLQLLSSHSHSSRDRGKRQWWRAYPFPFRHNPNITHTSFHSHPIGQIYFYGHINFKETEKYGLYARGPYI